MLRVTVPPAASVNGVVMPVVVNAGLLTLTWLMVVFVPPLLFRVMPMVLLDPEFTVPKAIRGVIWPPWAIAEFAVSDKSAEIVTRIAETRIRLMWLYLPVFGVVGLRFGTTSEHVERQPAEQ